MIMIMIIIIIIIKCQIKLNKEVGWSSVTSHMTRQGVKHVGLPDQDHSGILGYWISVSDTDTDTDTDTGYWILILDTDTG